MHFVIIGGDAAGMSAASRARRNDPKMRITVLEKTTDVSYSACGMPYNIADADRSVDDLVVRPAHVFREKQDINLLTGHCVTAVDAAAKTATAVTPDQKEATFQYDKLLIAAGARPVIPDAPGMTSEGVLRLKNLADGRKVKSYIAEKGVKKAVIIGMGYIALEMCEALVARDVRVAMVKPRPAFLPWMNEEMARVVRGELESRGVTILAGYAVESVARTGSGLELKCGPETLAADMVLAAVGVTPNSDLAEEAGIALSVGKSIAVDDRLQTSAPHVYAAGDCADAVHVVTGEKTWVPLALRANRAGWAAADNVCGRAARVRGVAGTSVFKVFDLEVARTGLNDEEAAQNGFDPASVMIKSRSRAHAHPGSSTIWVQMTGDRKTGRLLGARMVGKEGAAHRINAAAVALHNRMTVEDFWQTDLAYAPPFGPVWDPLLTAANQLKKKL